MGITEAFAEWFENQLDKNRATTLEELFATNNTQETNNETEDN